MTAKLDNRVLGRTGARLISAEELELISGGERITEFLTHNPQGFYDVLENVDG